MAALPSSSSEWVNLSLVEDHIEGKLDGELPALPYKHWGCLPGWLQDLPSPVTAQAALSHLLSVSANPSAQIEFQHIEFRSDPDGMTVEIKYEDRMTPQTARNIYIRASGDASDAMRFSRNRPEVPELYEVTLCFSQMAMQRSRKPQAIKLPGEIIRRITQEALKP